MAVKTSLRQVAERLSAIVRAFAASEGWDQDAIALAGAFDKKTEQISLIVGSDRQIDEMRWYSEIRQRIRGEFGSTSSIAYQISLVVQNVCNLAEISNDLILTEDEIDLTELL